MTDQKPGAAQEDSALTEDQKIVVDMMLCGTWISVHDLMKQHEDLTGMKPTAVTRMLNTLVRRGFVEKQGHRYRYTDREDSGPKPDKDLEVDQFKDAIAHLVGCATIHELQMERKHEGLMSRMEHETKAKNLRAAVARLRAGSSGEPDDWEQRLQKMLEAPVAYQEWYRAPGGGWQAGRIIKGTDGHPVWPESMTTESTGFAFSARPLVYHADPSGGAEVVAQEPTIIHKPPYYGPSPVKHQRACPGCGVSALYWVGQDGKAKLLFNETLVGTPPVEADTWCFVIDGKMEHAEGCKCEAVAQEPTAWEDALSEIIETGEETAYVGEHHVDGSDISMLWAIVDMLRITLAAHPQPQPTTSTADLDMRDRCLAQPQETND